MMTMWLLIGGVLAALIFKSNLVINTGLLEKGLRSEFFNRLDATPTAYQDLATRIQSNAAEENYRWLGSVPNMRELGNGRQLKGLRSESYSVANLEYEATIEVKETELEDDQTGQIRIRVQELAQRAATHKDYLIAQLLINGGTSGFNSYDGVTFFNNSHQSGASGEQDNNLSFNCQDHAKPTPDEIRAAYAYAVETMLGFKDDQGQPMALSESGLVVVVPPKLRTVMRTALQAQMLNNTTNVLAGEAQVRVLPWLTDATQFFVLKTDGVIRPFIFQDRKPIEFKAVSGDSEHRFLTGRHLYGVYARYAITYGYWQYAVRVTLS